MAQKLDWSEAATLKLIEIWGEDSIQTQLEGSKRNGAVFEKITCEMDTRAQKSNAEKKLGSYEKIKRK